MDSCSSCSSMDSGYEGEKASETIGSTPTPLPVEHLDSEPKETSSLWAWPLNQEGFVRCVAGNDKFRVALDFKYLLNRNAEMKKFENSKSNTSSYCFTIGLCSIKKGSDQSFWRLEVQVFSVNSLILIEAYRELFRQYSPSSPSTSSKTGNNKTLRKLRKIYRLPDRYDINTVTVTIADDQGAIVIEARRKERPRTLQKSDSLPY